jgi:hypothetical protein
MGTPGRLLMQGELLEKGLLRATAVSVHLGIDSGQDRVRAPFLVSPHLNPEWLPVDRLRQRLGECVN